MTPNGSCPCGAVRFSIGGAVRDVIVCHCEACREATGGPWPASAAHRRDLVVEDETTLAWERAAVSEHGASRGRCRTCGTVVLWDAPGRQTVSFAAALLAGGPELQVAAHIWVPAEEEERLVATGIAVVAGGLPESVTIRWRGETPATG